MQIETRVYSSAASWAIGSFYSSARFIEDAIQEGQNAQPHYAVVPTGRLGPVAKIEKNISGIVINLLTTQPQLQERLKTQVLTRFVTIPVYTTVTYNAELHVVGVERPSPPKEVLNRGDMIKFCLQYGLDFDKKFTITREKTFAYYALLNLVKATTNSDKVTVYIGDKKPGYVNRTFLLGPLLLVLKPCLGEIVNIKDDRELFNHLLWLKMYRHIPEIAKELRKQMTNSGLCFEIKQERLATLYWSYQ